jgi:HEAT repeat protein
MPWLRLHLLSALLVPGAESLPLADEALRQAAEDVRVLKAARVPTDGPGLVRFLRSQRLTADEEKRFAGLVRALGDRSFKVRDRATAELRARGPAVRPLLLRGLKGSDLETSRRLQRCLGELESKNWEEVWGAAARRVRVLRPEGGCAALLDCMPAAGVEAQDDLRETVLALGMRDGRPDPALAKALRDPEPSRRAAAALGLGWRGDAGQRAAVRQVLRGDADPDVRLRAAEGLLAGGDLSPIPALLTVLDRETTDRAERADELLRWVARDKAPAVPFGTGAAERRKASAAWRAWWDGQKGTFALSPREPLDFQAGATRRARTAVDAFLRAVIKGDVAAVRATTEVPFFVGTTGQVYKTRQELDSQIRHPENIQVVALRKVTHLSLYLRESDEATRRFFAPLAPSRVYTVLVDLSFVAKQESFALLVRVKGGSPRVVGIAKAKRR